MDEKPVIRNQYSDPGVSRSEVISSSSLIVQQQSTSLTESSPVVAVKKSTDEQQRNFRQSYYSKVGLGNDEEKMTALLNPVDIDKIKMYMKTYSISDAHRLKIWKILLGMNTTKVDDDYTSSLRKTTYDNLLKCLTVLGSLNESTSPVNRNVLIYKFEDDKMFNSSKCSVSQTDENLIKISESIVKNFKNFNVSDEDLFHLFSSFVNLINSYQHLYSQLVEEVLHMIAKEDVEYEKFLRKNERAINLIKTMFSRCLAGTLDSNTIIRLWDKVVAGYFRLLLPKIIHYILISGKHQLIQEDYSAILTNIIPKENLDHRILSLI